MSFTFKVLLLLAIAVMPIPAGAVELAVDCDAGDDLGRALKEITFQGGGRVHVSGVCVGPFVVAGQDFIEIEIVGDSPATSMLDSGNSNAAIKAGDSGVLRLRNLRLEGQIGLVAGGSRVVQMHDCEIDSTSEGVLAGGDASVSIVDSEITAGFRGVRVSKGGSAFLSRTLIHDCLVAATVVEGTLEFLAVDVRDCIVGVRASDRSTVTLHEGSFSGGAETRLGIERDSRLTLVGTRLGADDDLLVPALWLDDGSSAELLGEYNDGTINIRGNIRVAGDSYLVVRNSNQQGSIFLSEFSRLLFDGTQIDGTITCNSAADAWCGPSASASTLDCPGAPQSCAPLRGGSGPHFDLPGPLGVNIGPAYSDQNSARSP